MLLLTLIEVIARTLISRFYKIVYSLCRSILFAEICDIQITGKLVKVNRYEDGKILLYIGALLSNSQM